MLPCVMGHPPIQHNRLTYTESVKAGCFVVLRTLTKAEKAKQLNKTRLVVEIGELYFDIVEDSNITKTSAPLL